MHPVIASKNKLIELVQGLTFSGSGNVVGHKLDTFEKVGASVHLHKMRTDRVAMESEFERSQTVQITLTEHKDDVSVTPIDEVLFDLGQNLHEAVEAARLAGAFPEGVCVELGEQAIDPSPESANDGTLTQIYFLTYTENLTPTT